MASEDLELNQKLKYYQAWRLQLSFFVAAWKKKKYYISSRFLPLFCTMKKTIIWVCQIILNNMRVFHICTTLMRKYCFDEHMVLFRPSMYTWITFPSVAHSSQNYESHDLSALAARVHITHKAQRSAHACNQVSDVSSCLVASDAQFVQSELYIYWLRSTNSHWETTGQLVSFFNWFKYTQITMELNFVYGEYKSQPGSDDPK